MTGYFGLSLLETERKRENIQFSVKDLCVYGLDMCNGHEKHETHRLYAMLPPTLTERQRQQDRATDAVRIKSTMPLEDTTENLKCCIYHVT